MTQAIQEQVTTVGHVLYMAKELSATNWKVMFGDGRREREVNVPAGDVDGLLKEVAAAKVRFGLEEGVKVVSCYEAGRDGFWLHRYLVKHGVESLVVDSSSIEVNRRERRRKTDRLDAKKLLQLLIRYEHGEKKVWSVVRVPGEWEEDRRRLHRELDRLMKERTGHTNRIKSLLVLHGIRVEVTRRFLMVLEGMRLRDGSPVPTRLAEELRREYARYAMVEEQIKQVEKKQREEMKRPETDWEQKIAKLMRLYGLGYRSSSVYVGEFFGWRVFNNRRELAGAAGLQPTPYASGASRREQGISKAGNRRMRSMMMEIAWAWLRFQPASKLSRWFMERFALGGPRMRRIGIVALARKLLIALWRYVEKGEIPEGARLRATA